MDATQNSSKVESYSYDEVGNRLSSIDVSPYVYNDSNELTSTPDAEYSYDDNGNLLSESTGSGTTSYVWDPEDRLTSITLPGSGGTVSFQYDPFGRRIYKSSPLGATIFVYDGYNVIEEVSADGSLMARYTQSLGIDEPLAMLRGNTMSYYQADGLGSVTSLSDSKGNLVSTYEYDSFGNLLASTGSISNPFRYTGREFDAETDLYFYRARYYDPSIGRFISEDPIRFDAGTNFYTYCLNDPIMFIDPWGLCPEDRSYPEWLLRDIGPSDNWWSPWVTGQRPVGAIMWTPTAFFINRIPGGAPDVPYWPPFSPPDPCP